MLNKSDFGLVFLSSMLIGTALVVWIGKFIPREGYWPFAVVGVAALAVAAMAAWEEV